MKLSACLHAFFDTYLPNIKGVSTETIKTYRDTFTLFLPFIAGYYSTKVDALTLEEISIQCFLSFLDHLEEERNNTARTRNIRLATLKSFAKMICLLYPEYKELAQIILRVPKKRAQKNLIGFITQEEILQIYEKVDMRKKDGFRDYTMLHLLFDTGVRASEIANLNLDYFDRKNKTLMILGKGNKFRQVSLSLKTTELTERYISRHRTCPKPAYRDRLFINQRREEFTRYGIHYLCKKYLTKVLSTKRLQMLSAAHSFRHGSAVNRLYLGDPVTKIKNRLGHEDLQSSMAYLKLDIAHKREVQKKFIEHSESSLKFDPKLDEVLDWENKEKTLAWLDSL